jgi:hypothetical protein
MMGVHENDSIAQLCLGKIDLAQYPHNHENYRGMVDVYGQLSPLYATQKGGQMEPTGKMLRKLLGSP